MRDAFTQGLDANYRVLGVNAVLSILSTGAEPFTIRVIDQTRGIEVGDQPQVQTIRPAAAVRRYELTAKGVDVDDLEGAMLEFSGDVWIVESWIEKPAPKTGSAGGELYLLLTAAGGSDG